MAKSIQIEPQCPMDITLNVISGKWKLAILWFISKGPIRFNELQRQLPKITQKTLTAQLRELEMDGMIIRNIYPEVPPRVEYRLSEIGESIKPILASLCKWGKEYQQHKTV